MSTSQSLDRPEAADSPTQQGGCCSGWSLWKWSGILLLVIAVGLVAASLVRPDRAADRPADSGTADPASISTVPAEPMPATSEVLWQESYTAALAEASRRDMPVLLRFTASWCGPCRVMDEKVWPDERVNAALAQRAIPVKIDVDQQKEVARRYDVRSIPRLLLVDADGEQLASGGFMSAGEVVDFLASP